MKSIFKISRIGEFGLLIEGLEAEGEDIQYLSESLTISNDAYKWTQSVTINTVSTLNASGDETFEKYYVVDHEDCCNDRLEVQLKKDGLYRIAHIILPTKQWIDDYIEFNDNPAEDFDYFDKIYYYDDGKFYLWEVDSNKGTEVEFKTIYDEIPSDDESDESNRNTIVRSDKNTFAMYYLNDCFGKLLKNILRDFSRDCVNCSSDTNSKKIADRDLMWMFINVIKYSLDCGELYEAQRFLEKFNRCNIICDYHNLKKWDNDCGC